MDSKEENSPRISLLSDPKGISFEDPSSSVMESMNLSSTSASFSGEPPIPHDTTYHPASITEVSSRTATGTKSNSADSQWDYDNYLEKPRGHVAHPKYLNPQQQQEESPRGFSVESDSHLETGTPFTSSEHYTSIGFSPVLLAVLAYFFGWLGGLIIVVLEKKNMFVVFHAIQSLTCGALAFIIQIVFVWSKTLYTLLWIVYLVFTAFMIFKVIKDSATPNVLFKLPGIGDWCEERALNRIQWQSGVSTFYRF